MDIKWCGTPVSNRRPSAWQADALPTELVPHWKVNILFKDSAFKGMIIGIYDVKIIYLTLIWSIFFKSLLSCDIKIKYEASVSKGRAIFRSASIYPPKKSSFSYPICWA